MDLRKAEDGLSEAEKSGDQAAHQSCARAVLDAYERALEAGVAVPTG